MMNHVALELSSYNSAQSSEDDGTRCKAKEQMTISQIGLLLAESGGSSPLAKWAKESG